MNELMNELMNRSDCVPDNDRDIVRDDGGERDEKGDHMVRWGQWMDAGVYIVLPNSI